jgi:amino acid transporter
MWVAGFVTLISLINMRSVNLVAHFNLLFVGVQVAIIAVFIYLCVRGLDHGEGLGTAWSLMPFADSRPSSAPGRRCDHPVLLVPGLRRGHLPVRRNPRPGKTIPARSSSPR